MAGLNVMEKLKIRGGKFNFIVIGNDMTQNNGMIKK